MSREELFALFPIQLAQHQAAWETWYEEEERRIRALFPPGIARIYHIGSTAVAGIWAKPIIDLLVELPDLVRLKAVSMVLENNGFLVMSREKERISLNRGCTKEGFADRGFHAHLRLQGDHEELFFRDDLRDHEETAQAYEELKLRLWQQYPNDREADTAAKTDFIQEITQKARLICQHRDGGAGLAGA